MRTPTNFLLRAAAALATLWANAAATAQTPRRLAATPAVRIPAEWEPHAATWLQWPKGEERSYRANFAGIVHALQRFEPVHLLVGSAAAGKDAAAFLRQRGVPLGNVRFHVVPYDWSWMRDNGPVWAERTATSGGSRLLVQDWGFDGWGGIGGPSTRDNGVPAQIARIVGAGYESIPLVLERGTLEFNGRDAMIVSWPVLSGRNPRVTRAQFEAVFKEKFGVTKIVWLHAQPTGDLTGGHVDGIARFVGANAAVVSRYLDPRDPDAAGFEQSAALLRAAGINVTRLDVPGYIRYRGVALPANYTNYLVANGVVVASSYGHPAFDANARRQLQQLFPTREIVMVDTRELWLNGGAVHCVTNDQPAVR